MYQVDFAFLMLETDDLEEAKSIATFTDTNKVRQRAIDKGFHFDRGAFMDHRRNVTTVANKKFEALFRSTAETLSRLTGLFHQRKLTFPALSKQAKAVMREAYKQAYLIGLKSGGVGHTAHPFVTPAGEPKLSSHDLTFIDSAYRHEMRYMTTLLNQMREGTQWGDPYKRMGAYAEALKHMYYSGRIMGSPKELVIDWISPLDRRTCRSCRYLAGQSPFTRDSLPTTPRAGDSVCLCITTPESRVLTRRGPVPICEVRVGDEVWTHQSRWRMVTGTHINLPRLHHRQAWIIAPTGQVVGCTSDHPFLTPSGWASLTDIDMVKLPLYAVGHEHLQAMYAADPERLEDRSLPGLSPNLPDLRGCEGSQSERVPFLRYEPEGHIAVGGPILEGSSSSVPAALREVQTEILRGSDVGVLQLSEEGRSQVCLLLGERNPEVDLPLPVGVDQGQRADSSWHGAPSSERQSGGRPAGEPGTIGSPCPSPFPHDGAPQAEDDRRPSPVQATLLYDLTVEEDHSFIIEGLVVHNSNCRCRLVMRSVTDEALKTVKRSKRSKDFYLRKLKEIKAGKAVG